MIVSLKQHLSFGLLDALCCLPMPERYRLPSNINLVILSVLIYIAFLQYTRKLIGPSAFDHIAHPSEGLHAVLTSSKSRKTAKVLQQIQRTVNEKQTATNSASSYTENKNIQRQKFLKDGTFPLNKTVHLKHNDEPPDVKTVEKSNKFSLLHLPFHKKTIEDQIIEKTQKEWFKVITESPVFKSIPKNPLRVGYVTKDTEGGISKHFFLDGIEGSDYLDLVYTCLILQKEGCQVVNKIDLWLIDASGAKQNAKPGDIIHQLLHIENPTFQILFVDFSDRLVPRAGFLKHHYPNLNETVFQQSHIRFGIRGIARGRNRKWKTDRGIGKLLPPTWEGMLHTKQGLPFHAPFAVRSDFVNFLQDIIPSIARNSSTIGSSSKSIPFHPVDCMKRSIDIIHLWDPSAESGQKAFRDFVTRNIRQMADLDHPLDNNRKIQVEWKLQGHRAQKGRFGVSKDYAKIMLQSKIVVVTQRDQWEDHFRLFEAITSGAMVLMDEMLALPHSLKDGESVVFFHSMQDLQEIAMYYLQNPQERMAIARRGWEIAMTEHRSWHRLEEMLFGQGLTKTTVEESWFVSN